MTGYIIEGDSSGLSSIQVRSSHSDECAPNTGPIVRMDFCDVGNLEGQFIIVL